jgi:hypothetical protein
VELLEIEMKARLKGATSEQISSIRRVNDASARDRLRQEKATSSQTGSPFTTPGTMTPSYHSQLYRASHKAEALSECRQCSAFVAGSGSRSAFAGMFNSSSSSEMPEVEAKVWRLGVDEEHAG